MFAQKFLEVASLASIVLSTQLAAQPQAMAKPEGQWIVDFADDHCLAGHKFQTDFGETVFQFEPDMMRRRATVKIIVPKGELTDRQWGEIAVDWSGRPADAKPNPFFQVMKLNDTQRLLVFPIDTDKLPKSSTLDLRISFTKNAGFAFSLPNWANLQKLLDHCVAELRTSKGFPGQEYELAKSHAEGDVLRQINANDYPAEAFKKKEQGVVSVRYWIEADGRASDCVVDVSSGSRSLDDQTCRVIMRMRFKPAVGQDGKPMREPGSTRLRWSLPD